MISRLTLSAGLFAVLATATLAYAAETQQQRVESARSATAAMPVIVLPKVEITGKRVR